MLVCYFDIMRKTNIIFIALACLILLNFTFASSYTNFNKSFQISGYGINIIPPNYSIQYTNASLSSINEATIYLTNRLGKDYYDSYITTGFRSYNARYYPSLNQTYVYFSYDAPLSNGTKITAFNLTEGCCSIFPSSPLFAAVVLANNGSILYYAGPYGPYTINISYNSALNITANRGLNTSHGAYLVAGSFNPYDSSSGYIVTWAVLGNGSSSNPGTGNGIYIDAENGNVLGEFYWESSPGGTLPGSPEPTIYILGNYSLFPISSNANSYAKSNNNFLFIVVVIVAVIIIAITLLYKTARVKN